MGSDVDALLARGQAALADYDWETARLCFAEAIEAGERAEAVDGLGQALYWQGDYPRSLALRERAHVLYRRRDDHRSAARVAVQLAALHWMIYANEAAMSGWLAHAERLVEEAGDCPERGWLELFRAAGAEDPAECERRARAATEIGRRFGEPGLEFDAISAVGRSLVARGAVRDGMRLIDEAVAAIAGGVVADPWAAGEIYCTLFGACEMVVDVKRAQAWLRAVDNYVEDTGELPISAICRMHYGGLLVAAGRWSDAERELLLATEIYDETYRGTRFEPVLRLADLRARQGRLAEAERLIEGYEDLPEAVSPRARIHLARGEPGLAALTLDRFLTRRGRGLASVPLLCLLVEALLAGGKVSEARRVAGELAELGDACGQPSVRGLAALSRARVAAAAGDAGAAGNFEEALAAFVDAELPYDLARARLEYATTVAESRPDVARSEARAALAGFEEVRASPDADAAAALLRRLGDRARSWPKGSGTLTRRETEVLSLLAEGCSNNEIAQRLYVSPRTAEHHVTNILGKLRVANRAEAAAYAVRARADD